jgi:hypothetical protein
MDIRFYYFNGRLHRVKYDTDAGSIVEETSEIRVSASSTIVKNKDCILVKDTSGNSITLTGTANLYTGDPFAVSPSLSAISYVDFDGLHRQLLTWRESNPVVI